MTADTQQAADVARVLADELNGTRHAVGFTGNTEFVDYATQRIAAALAAAEQRGQDAEREANCKAICPYCRNGLPLICDSQLKPTVHRGQYNELTCYAAAIRARSHAAQTAAEE